MESPYCYANAAGLTLGFNCIDNDNDCFCVYSDGKDVAQYLISEPKIAIVILPDDTVVYRHCVNCLIVKEFVQVEELDGWYNETFCISAVQGSSAAYNFIRVKTTAVLLAAITTRPETLLEIIPQTEYICKEAIRTNPAALQYVHSQTEELCIQALTGSWNSLEFVENQTDRICLYALECNPFALKHIRNKTRELCEFAVNRNGCSLGYVPEELKTDELCLMAMRQTSESYKRSKILRHMPKPSSSSLCITLMKEFRVNVSHIFPPNPTLEMCRLAMNLGNYWPIAEHLDATDSERMQAVKNNGSVIRVMKNKTKELCEQAVKNSPWALEYIKPELQTEAMCLDAVLKDPKLLKFVAHPTPAVCTAVVRDDPEAFEQIQDQTYDICKAAIETDHRAFKFVRQKTPELFKIYLDAKKKYDDRHSDSDSVRHSDYD